MKTIVLSDTDYNNLIALSSPEQLAILNSNYQEQNLNRDILSIRVLSSNEYDTYIKNGTCDGTIIAGSINVWNQDNSIGVGVINDGWNWDAAPTDPFITQHRRLPSYSGTVSYDYSAKSEHVLNNTSSDSMHKFFNTITFKVQAGEFNGYWIEYSGINTIIFDNHKLWAKNLQLISSSISNSKRANGDTANVILNYKFLFCFRPVFQYKDNNKSTNIHY